MRKRGMILAGAIGLLLILLTNRPHGMAQPKDELTIVMSAWGSETLVPSSETGKGMDYMKLLYDPIFGSTPDGRLSREHGIAEKWEMSPDGLTWTITIRRGAKFHDGVEVTAKDVKFSMEQSRTASLTRYTTCP